MPIQTLTTTILWTTVTEAAPEPLAQIKPLLGYTDND
jgi:hypothetical protein